jgi:hypothetical protein
VPIVFAAASSIRTVGGPAASIPCDERGLRRNRRRQCLPRRGCSENRRPGLRGCMSWPMSWGSSLRKVRSCALPRCSSSPAKRGPEG